MVTGQSDCKSIAVEDGFVKYERDYTQPFSKNEVKYRVTFFKDYVYRVLICSDQKDSIAWELVDKDGNLLFSNKKYNLSNYWDFKFETTIECYVKINPEDISGNLKNIILYLSYKD